MAEDSKPGEPQADLVTKEDHRNGYKTLRLEFRDGEKRSFVVRALGRRELRELTGHGVGEVDFDRLVQTACPDVDLDKLVIGDALLLEMTAYTLAFGDSWQKKMVALGEEAAEAIRNGKQTTAQTGSGLRPAALDGAGRPATSSDGPARDSVLKPSSLKKPSGTGA